MPSDSLPPIPIPLSHRWREFRVQVLPFIVFLGLVVAVVFLWRNFVQPRDITDDVDEVKASVISVADRPLADSGRDDFNK